MIRVLLTDPASVEVEALVRSVDSDLEACTAIGRTVGERAGEEVLERLQGSGAVPVGGALVTPGGELPMPLLIHVVVRSPDEPISETSVRNALMNGLRQASEWEVGVLAVPPLGIGAGNLDAETSARVMCGVLAEHVSGSPFPREVVIVVANAYEEEAFRRELRLVESGSMPTSAGPGREEES